MSWSLLAETRILSFGSSRGVFTAPRMELLMHWLDALTTFVLNIHTFITHCGPGRSTAGLQTVYPFFHIIYQPGPNKFRSIIREVVKVFTKSPIKLIVSGAGLSLTEFDDSTVSGVSEPAEALRLFYKFGVFDTWSKLKSFSECYVPASLRPFSNHAPGIAYNIGCGNIFRDGESTLASSFSTKRVSLAVDLASLSPLWSIF